MHTSSGGDSVALGLLDEATANPAVAEQSLAAVEDAYSELAFSVFARADTLDEDHYLRLATEADAVATRASSLGFERTAGHVDFVRRLGAAVRAVPRPTEVPVDLPGLWGTTAESVDELSLLYRRELAVWKEWSVLRESVNVAITATVHDDLTALCSWTAPWYVVHDAAAGRYRPVSIDGSPLAEAAGEDVIPDDVVLPVYPNPLPHGVIPASVRRDRVAGLERLILEQGPTTVCALPYRLAAPGSPTVVLDGNHRLGAALRMRRHTATRVLAFTVTETAPVETPTGPVTVYDGAQWRGFTPDLAVVRDVVSRRELAAPVA